MPIKIHDLTSIAGGEELRRALYPSPSYEDFPVRAAVHHLRNLGVKCAIEERGYVCKDFMAEYSAFYSKTFWKFSNRCIRLHFFKKIITKDEIARQQLKSKHYLGYSILRPTRTQRLGRTVLAVPGNTNSYSLCKTESHVNFLGNDLSIQGVPFIQQDAQVGACSHACLWMAARFLHLSGGMAWSSPVQIAEAATKYRITGRGITAGFSGLDSHQVMEAVRSFGMTPLRYCAPFTKVDPAKTIYTYVESELPVILLTKSGDAPQGHALFAFGHTFRPRKGSKTWPIKEALVHDDSRGPYQRFPLSESRKADPSSNGYLLSQLRQIIVLLPPEVVVSGEEAERGAIGTLTAIARDSPTTDLSMVFKPFFSQLSQPIIDQLREFQNHDDLVLRTMLIDSNRFKQACKQSQASGGMPLAVRQIYGQMQLPKYVWMTEISTRGLFYQAEKDNRLILGEILQDATSPPLETPIISAHLLGGLFFRVFDKQAPVLRIEDDRPYQHLNRP